MDHTPSVSSYDSQVDDDQSISTVYENTYDSKRGRWAKTIKEDLKKLRTDAEQEEAVIADIERSNEKAKTKVQPASMCAGPVADCFPQ